MKFDRFRRIRTDLDELYRAQERLRATVERIETEWGDVKDQVRRSYQRLEKAAQRLEPRPPTPLPSEDEVRELEANLDPFSKKILQARRQQDALHAGPDESAG